MDFLQPSEIGGYTLDDVEEMFSALVDTCKDEPVSPQQELSPGINFDEDSFIWEDVKLSDGMLSQSSAISGTDLVAIKQAEINAGMPNIPDIDILQAAVSELPASPSASVSSDSESDSPRSNTNPLLAVYGINDDQLSDITLKKLKSMCNGNSEHYDQLKAYRRTCLNRHYARSSRAKTQNKTICLSTELTKANQTIKKLSKDKDEQAATIKYLQLELEILRSMKR